MSKTTSISNSRPFARVPAAFLAAAFLAVCTEAAVYSLRTNLVRDHWNKFLLNERWMVQAPDVRAVVLGNSIHKTGLDPTLIAEDLAILGVPGAKPIGQEMLLRRYLDSGKTPEVLYLYVDPEEQYDSMLAVLRYFASPAEAFRVWTDLTPLERRVFFGRYFATLDLRGASMAAGRPQYPHQNDRFIGEMLEHRGFMPSPRAAERLPADWFDKPTPRGDQKCSFEERDRKYLRRIMALARERGMRVVFLSLVAPEGAVREWEESGFLRDYRALRESIRREFPEASWEEPPVTALGHEFFGDHTHLNAEGARAYSGRFARFHAGASGGAAS